MVRPLFVLTLALAGLAPLSFAQDPVPRQSYSAWTKHSTKNYYYRYYYFKKSASDAKPSHHYAIYFPSRGKRIYMYNPETRKYWGAWEGDKYSLLPKDKQKGSIDEIALDDFPRFGTPPTIPGADGKVAMIPPPRDFPKVDDERP